MKIIKANYTVNSSSSFLKYDEIIVSNFESSNVVTNWIWHGCSNKKTLGENSIGKWKIKKLDNNWFCYKKFD